MSELTNPKNKTVERSTRSPGLKGPLEKKEGKGSCLTPLLILIGRMFVKLLLAVVEQLLQRFVVAAFFQVKGSIYFVMKQ